MKARLAKKILKAQLLSVPKGAALGLKFDDTRWSGEQMKPIGDMLRDLVGMPVILLPTGTDLVLVQEGGQ